MSIINSWTSQYSTLAGVTDSINESVQVLIKEKQVSKYPQLADKSSFQVTDEQVHDARKQIASLIENLIAPIASDPVAVYRTAPLPEDLLDEYRERLEENQPARKRFEQLYSVLQSDKPVRDADKPALDDLVMTLDGSRKEIFQKLRQSGG
ncbi:hypothetical protein ACAW74_05890 [Fibrella sp. WM1]|uniref:hypothetical protein n=1 Tax=Fibrella musci TaxID=3242485 RepID=UPI0035229CE5